jgi:hypothetical protein
MLTDDLLIRLVLTAIVFLSTACAPPQQQHQYQPTLSPYEQ